jgi:hypothetical protein
MMMSTLPESTKQSNDGAAPSLTIREAALRALWSLDGKTRPQTDGLTLTDLIVMNAIVLHVNYQDGDAFPTVARLARICRMSARTVQRVLQRQRERAETNQHPFITIEPGGNVRGRWRKSNVFHIAFSPDISASRTISRTNAAPRSHDGPSLTPAALVAAYNAAAEQHGWRTCLGSDGARAAVIKRALREHPTQGYWNAVIDRLAASDFACGRAAGRSGRFWQADFDKFIEDHARILEGKYDDHGTDGTDGRRHGRARNYDDDLPMQSIKIISGDH